MSFELPVLPFVPDDFEPWLSAEAFAYHHGKHHAAYIKKLNATLKNNGHAEKTLEDLIRDASNNPVIFNNAAQHWNHEFFWNCLSATKQEPSKDIGLAIARDFGSFDSFKKEFSEKALTLFGSGWTWLTFDPDEGVLEVGQYPNATTPLTTGEIPLLTLDVWEHAYYIDHRNDRESYIEGFWDHVDWEAVVKRLP